MHSKGEEREHESAAARLIAGESVFYGAGSDIVPVYFARQALSGLRTKSPLLGSANCGSAMRFPELLKKEGLRLMPPLLLSAEFDACTQLSRNTFEPSGVAPCEFEYTFQFTESAITFPATTLFFEHEVVSQEKF